MSLFVPVFFVCLTNNVCEFVYTDPLLTEQECRTELTNKMDYLEAHPGVHSYRMVCLEINPPELTQTKLKS